MQAFGRDGWISAWCRFPSTLLRLTRLAPTTLASLETHIFSFAFVTSLRSLSSSLSLSLSLFLALAWNRLFTRSAASARFNFTIWRLGVGRFLYRKESIKPPGTFWCLGWFRYGGEEWNHAYLPHFVVVMLIKFGTPRNARSSLFYSVCVYNITRQSIRIAHAFIDIAHLHSILHLY